MVRGRKRKGEFVPKDWLERRARKLRNGIGVPPQDEGEQPIARHHDVPNNGDDGEQGHVVVRQQPLVVRQPIARRVDDHNVPNNDDVGVQDQV